MTVQLATNRTKLPAFRFVPAEWADMFVSEKIPEWYKRLAVQSEHPRIMCEDFLNDPMDDVLSFEQECFWRNLHMNFPEDFPRDWSKWNEEQSEEADENYCSNSMHYDRLLLDDIETALNCLRLAYTEDESHYTSQRPNWVVYNNPIVEVW